MERRGLSDVRWLDFSPLYADYRSRRGIATVAAAAAAGSSGTSVVGRPLSREELEGELTAARREGTDAVRALGTALFSAAAAGVTAGGRGGDGVAGGADEVGGSVSDSYAILTFVTLCIALRGATGGGPQRGSGTQASASEAGNEARKAASDPAPSSPKTLPPPHTPSAVKFFGLRALSHSVAEIQRQLTTASVVLAAKQVGLAASSAPMGHIFPSRTSSCITCLFFCVCRLKSCSVVRTI
jgi:hypothetical protein